MQHKRRASLQQMMRSTLYAPVYTNETLTLFMVLFTTHALNVSKPTNVKHHSSYFKSFNY